jgi:hypothetical protein
VKVVTEATSNTGRSKTRVCFRGDSRRHAFADGRDERCREARTGAVVHTYFPTSRRWRDGRPKLIVCECPTRIALLKVASLNLYWRLMQSLWFRLLVRLLLLIFFSLSCQTCSEAQSVAHSGSDQAISIYEDTGPDALYALHVDYGRPIGIWSTDEPPPQCVGGIVFQKVCSHKNSETRIRT